MGKVKIFLFLFIFILNFSSNFAYEKIDTSSYHFKEVVVAALRYPETMLEVPLSVSYFSKQNFIGIRGLSLEEPLARVPGVLVQTRNGSQDIRIIIRGFGARGAGDRSNSGTVRGLRFLLDGVPQTEPDGRTSLDLFDIAFVENIEVLRSNASALWGNASGGVLSFSTVPEIRENSATYSFTTGNWGLAKNVLKLQSQIGEKGLIYLNSLQSKFDGWRENSQSEKLLFNFGLNSPISKKTTFLVNINFANNLFHIPGAITQVAFDSLPKSAYPIYLRNKERRHNKIGQISTTITHNFDENNSLQGLAFLTSKYLQRSERGTFRDFTRYFFGTNLTYRNQLDFSHFKNVLLLGFDQTTQDGAILFYALDSNANRSNNLQTDKREGAGTFGAFIQNEFIFDRLSLILGLRYDNVTYYSQDYLAYSISDTKKFNRLTPKFALSYRVAENVSLFGNIGGGIEVPAGNETDPAPTEEPLPNQINPLLNPIISTTYELGVKSFIGLRNILQSIEFELSSYYISVNNELVPYREGRFYFSAGKTERLGLESNVRIDFDRYVKLEGSLTYLSHRFVNYKVDSGYYDPTKAGIFADFKDNKLPGIPNLFYNLSLSFPILLKFEFSMQGVGKYFADDANKYEVPSYNIFNAKVWFDQLYVGSFMQISLSFSVNNIADSKYVGSAFINPIIEKGSNLPYFIEPGLPRNFVFSVAAKLY